jgi:hypothetical protein
MLDLPVLFAVLFLVESALSGGLVACTVSDLGKDLPGGMFVTLDIEVNEYLWYIFCISSSSIPITRSSV